MGGHRRYRINCDGLAEDGSPCPEVAEGEMTAEAVEYPTPSGWLHLAATATVGSDAGDHVSPLDLYFHSQGCEGRWHAGPFAQWLQDSDAAV